MKTQPPTLSGGCPFYALLQPTGPFVRLASSNGCYRPSASSDNCCTDGRTRTYTHKHQFLKLACLPFHHIGIMRDVGFYHLYCTVSRIWRCKAFCLIRTCDPGETRTHGPYIKSVLLYQLSYRILKAVRTGLEPATPCVTGMYSNQLNYRTIFVPRTGIEPVRTSLLTGF